MRRLAVVLALLLGARLGVSVASTAGAEWDFTQYYRTATRIVDGEAGKLYRIDRASMDRFLAAIGEPTGESPPDAGEELVPSGRLGHVGMPLSAYYLAPLGLLEPRAALFAFKLAGALCFAAGWWLLYRPFRRAAGGHLGEERALPVYLGMCLVFEPFWFVFTAGGQSTPLNFLLLVLFYRLYVDDRPAPAALALALGVLVKPFFLLTGFVLLLARDRRPFLYLALFLSLAGLLSLAVFGLELHLEWLEVLRVSAAGLAEPWWNNCAVLGALYTFWSAAQGSGLEPAGEPQGLVRAAVSVYKVGVLLLFAALTRKPAAAELEPHRRRHQVALLAVLFPVLFSSIVWPHYLAFLFLPLLFLLFPASPADRLPRLLAWAVFLSTLSVRGRFLQREILAWLDAVPPLQALLAGFLGAAPTILALALLVLYRKRAAALLAGPEALPEPATA